MAIYLYSPCPFGYLETFVVHSFLCVTCCISLRITQCLNALYIQNDELFMMAIASYLTTTTHYIRGVVTPVPAATRTACAFLSIGVGKKCPLLMLSTGQLLFYLHITKHVCVPALCIKAIT